MRATLAARDPLAEHPSFIDLAPISSTIRSERPGGTARGVAIGVGTVREELFQHLVAYVAASGIEGDYVETGVHNGASAVAVGRAMQCLNLTRSSKLWLYDSWEGFPQTTESEDGRWATKTVAGGTAGTNWGAPGGANAANVDNVKNGLRKVHVPDDACVFRKGWFDQTFAMEKPAKVAFLHVDSDLYKSVLDTLVAFYDLVVEGGVILFDDFGHFEGARRAFYEYLVDKKREYPLLERHGHQQAFFVKGRQHDRAASATGQAAYRTVIDVCGAAHMPKQHHHHHGSP